MVRFGLEKSTVEAIRSVFARHAAVEQVLIFGSRAKGCFKRGSDIDLALQGGDLKRDEILRIEIELDELMLPYIFDIVDDRRISSCELIKHIERVGQVFYARAPKSHAALT